MVLNGTIGLRNASTAGTRDHKEDRPGEEGNYNERSSLAYLYLEIFMLEQARLTYIDVFSRPRGDGKCLHRQTKHSNNPTNDTAARDGCVSGEALEMAM